MRAIIAGGGIGGLTTALALNAVGWDVQVLEAVSEIKPLGVGINVLPHAGRVLNKLGLMEALAARAVATRELVYYNRHGQRIWGEPRGLGAGHEVPQLSVHRGHLHLTLLEAVRERLGPDTVLTGRRVTAFSAEGDLAEVTAVAPDGTETRYQGDIFIAADGIHSVVRRALYPNEAGPVWGGRILWRGLTPGQPFLTGASMIMAGHQDRKFVAYPITPPDADGRQSINWIAELTVAEMPGREDWNKPGNIADFLPSFEDWRFDWLDVPGLIRGARAIFEFPLVDRDPLPTWRHGRMALLGDAAHPMYPVGSNGASQAVLDAEALAAALALTPGASIDVMAGLAAYEAQRQPATAAIVLANRANGPEQCMQLAEERAPDGFASIEDVFAPGELEAMSLSYQRLTGLRRAPTAVPWADAPEPTDADDEAKARRLAV